MNRRLLLTRIVQGFSVTGLAFLTWPFVKALLPKGGEALSIDVRIDDLEPGEFKVVHFLGRNLFVTRRTRDAVAALESPTQPLKDPLSEASQQPGNLANPWRSLRPEVFVAWANCTHLGCEVVPADQGFKCPCHQSDYDAAGRVVEGAAAPLNLEVPAYRFLSRTTIRIEKTADA